jgi:hypothetical protein
MSGIRLIRSDGVAGATLRLSTALAAAGAPVVKATTEDVFMLAATPTTGPSSSALVPASRRTSNREQRQLRFTAGAAGPVEAPVLTAWPADAAAPVAADGLPAADAAPAADGAPPALLQKYSTHIEALDNYELLRFIPVTIEPLGDRVFVAEAADLNLSITGQTAEDAVQLLKELLVRVYEGNRSKRHHLDAERRRQQRTLETYIGRPKGSWHWA